MKKRTRIYQLFVRLFGNTHAGSVLNGTLEENGVGKFNDLNAAALESLRALGFTHLWLTGVLSQASATDYSSIGIPADDPDLLKGVAGSPYAIKDVFDVCPDYAEDPANRLSEFRELLARIHQAGLKALIDLVPNHVARSHRSRVSPENDFGVRGRGGQGDDRDVFFDAQNNFFYLQPGSTPGGPPLVLPTFREGRAISATCKAIGGCDGRFEGELHFGRVTGNNVVSWSPTLDDWYETVKLNYGYDFTTGRREYPHEGASDKPRPDTWVKMDRVIAGWQAQGVDGFRCDMAHLVPPEFWAWAIPRARKRDAESCFIAEAYDNDPARVPSSDATLAALNNGHGNVVANLFQAGFDGVYDDPSYKVLKRIYDGPSWANDLDGVLGDPRFSGSALRYTENHDETRLAAAGEWDGVGMEVGRPVSALLYGLSTGPVLLYNGQEVGEPAAKPAGFGGYRGRTSLFDYCAMPELAKWVNSHRYDGGGLSPAQRELRAFYGRLLRLLEEPAFSRGGLFCLNAANNQSRNFGRLPGEPASGHWMYAFLRYDAATGQRFLAVINLHRSETFSGIQIAIPGEALHFLELDPGGRVTLTERLLSSLIAPFTAPAREITLAAIPPLTPYYFEIAADKS